VDDVFDGLGSLCASQRMRQSPGFAFLAICTCILGVEWRRGGYDEKVVIFSSSEVRRFVRTAIPHFTFAPNLNAFTSDRNDWDREEGSDACPSDILIYSTGFNAHGLCIVVT
jgi:hypothetical protein